MTAAQTGVVYADGPWTHRDIAANGARFHLAEVGEGPVVLLLHGFPQFWWTWRHQMTALAAAGFRAVAMDLRGYGASDRTPRGYDPVTLALDVTGVIRSLGEPDATVVGHDVGALLGWTAAVLRPKVIRRLVTVSMAHPRRLRSALLSDRRQMAASSHIYGFQRPWLPERRLVRDGAAQVGEFLRDWSGPVQPSAAETDRYRQAMLIPGTAHCTVEYYRWMLRSVPRPDGLQYTHRMRTPVNVPVLQLHGALDPVVLPDTAAGSGRYVAAPYRWRLLEGVGHFPHEESPQTFNQELLGWLKDPEPDR